MATDPGIRQVTRTAASVAIENRKAQVATLMDKYQRAQLRDQALATLGAADQTTLQGVHDVYDTTPAADYQAQAIQLQSEINAIRNYFFALSQVV